MDLPHTPGCLVCGRENPHGLHLDLQVNPDDGVVSASFTPRPEHIGFEGITHGGALAAVLDEAMVWAATWARGRFCLCGEMTVRFRAPAPIGQALDVRASVESLRPRLVRTTAEIHDASGNLVASASAKYVPLAPEQNAAFVQTIVDDPATRQAARRLREVAGLGETTSQKP